MRSDVISISDLGRLDLAAWEELGAAAVSRNPFAEREFVLPAARGWGVDDLGVLVVRDGTQWLAALPVRSVRSWRSVPGRCLAGWRHSYCYLGTPLVAGGGDPEAILAMLIRRGLQVGGCLGLDWLDVDGPLAGALTAALASASRPVEVEQFERAALYRRDQPDYLEQTLSARHRKEYQRKLRLLEREVGELTLRDRSDDPAAYERFLELERSGWKGKAGTAMASRPGHGEFFIEMARGFARSGRFLMLSLESEQRTVAMRCDLLAGEISFNFKVAFDEQLGRFSPGIQLYIANLERFHASGRAWSDSCADADNATLNRLWFGRRGLRSVVATPRRVTRALPYVKWRLAAEALPLRRRLSRSQSGRAGR
jgi:CelD/BcsL family acetyltransferase involved in cellulose biosynthesis